MPATSAGMTGKLTAFALRRPTERATAMKKANAKYSKGEIGRVRIVEDFLPSPDRLVLREDNVKVTLSLSQRSVTFFKRAARQRRVPYQRMIRALVDAYAEKQEGKR
jgi:predicted DNA binding CopG/RHH family protein